MVVNYRHKDYRLPHNHGCVAFFFITLSNVLLTRVLNSFVSKTAFDFMPAGLFSSSVLQKILLVHAHIRRVSVWILRQFGKSKNYVPFFPSAFIGGHILLFKSFP